MNRSRTDTERGILVMLAAVVVFSSASTIVKWSDHSGAAIAFWRMLGASVAWWLVLVVRRVRTGRPFPSSAAWRRSAPAGVCFGANIAVFFAAIGHTSVAHGEFITSLSPLLVVPLGAIVFGHRPNVRALPFGLLTVAGLAIVLFNGAASSETSWRADAVIAASLVAWTGYLLFGRRARLTVDVVDFMSTVMPIATVAAAPVALLQAGDALWPLNARAWTAVVTLSVLTGMVGHGLIAVAQRQLDVGTIAIMQVAQPAIALGWAWLILGEAVALGQVPGMVLVLAGLVGFILAQRRIGRSEADSMGGSIDAVELVDVAAAPTIDGNRERGAHGTVG